MNRKKNITVILFTSCLIFLVALQAYYIYNSYRLEEKDLTRQARLIADKVLDEMEKYDTDQNDDKLIGDFEKLKTEITIHKEKIIHPERLYTSEPFHSKQLEKILNKNLGDSDFKIALRNEVFSVRDEVKNEELLPKNRSIILFQTANKMTEPLLMHEGKWSSHQSRENKDLNLNEKNFYLVKSKTTFQLLNIKLLIIRKIIPLIIISLLIVVLIIYLFWNSIKNLNRQEKKISQLHTSIDSIAHELNTPITTLKFSIVQSSDSETKSLLERQIKRLENIVKSIHQSDSEDIIIDKSEMKFYFSNIQKTYNQINFKINLSLIENKVLQRSDFTQMMDNLIDNSVKYGAKNLNISINKNLEIEVCDDGIGIPKEDQKHIFDKYYRVSRTENLNINGLGVGLFLVKKIVEKYKGTIEVVSKTIGVSFKIKLTNEN